MSLIAQGQDTGHCHPPGMADAEAPSGHAARRRSLRGAADQLHLRRRTKHTMNNDVGEGYASAKTSAKRLQHRLFGGEPASEVIDAIGSVASLVKLSLDEAARDQWVARILDPTPKFGDVHQIDPMPDDVHDRANFFFTTIDQRATVDEDGIFNSSIYRKRQEGGQLVGLDLECSRQQQLGSHREET